MIDEKKLIEEIHCYFINMIAKSELEVIDNNILKLNKEICSIIRKQPKVNEWIAVEERLPKEDERILCSHLGRFIDCGVLIGESWCCDMDEYSITKNDVIAWMPLPKPYNADRKKVK